MKSVVIILTYLVCQIAAQRDDGSQQNNKFNTLEWCVPLMVAVAAAFIIITAVIMYTVYRQKKYGAFCCLMPKMRYRIGTEEVGETFQRRDFPSPPPSYNMNRYIIAPPEYCDALQDVLLDSGHGSGETAVSSESRYTAWSNVVINTAEPPAYSVATSGHTPTTEMGPEELQRHSADTASITDSINSLSYTTTSTSPLNLVSSGDVITGAAVISPSHQQSSDAETTVCREKQNTVQSSTSDVEEDSLPSHLNSTTLPT